ncbi:MAG: SPASM domain-containing protein [Deltaproteobacteria bacterium]|nr:SPASM domain-containing protein [Deltaproteobacteria bacterium]
MTLCIDQIGEMFAISREMGFLHTVAPAHQPLASDSGRPGYLDLPRLTDSERLRRAIDFGGKQPNNRQSRFYLDGIAGFAGNSVEKICPYVTRVMRTYKVYMLYNGDIRFCERVAIGNILKNSFGEILRGGHYNDAVNRMKRCKGCWYICYVEPMILSNPINLFAKPKCAPSAVPAL